ncbi:MAG: aspartyl protease family protein [Chitinophagales bacterium]
MMKSKLHFLLCVLTCYLSAIMLCPNLLAEQSVTEGNSDQAKYPGFRITNGADFVHIPIETHNNLILLPIQINNTVSVNFILDTGVKTTILTEPLIADMLTLKRRGYIKIRGLGEGEPILADIARDVKLNLSNSFVGEHLNMVVLPQNMVSFSEVFGRPVYGLIGYEVFKDYVVEISYSNKYIRLHKTKKYKPRGGYEEYPIMIDKAKPYIETQVIYEDGRNFSKKLLLDTGASQAISIFEAGVELPKPNLSTYLGKGITGEIHGHIARVERIQLGKFAFDNVIVGYPEATSLQLALNTHTWNGNLGAEILKRFTVIFDYSRERLYLRKNWNYKRPFYYNVSGLEFLATGNKYDRVKICYIRPDSPADVAGLKVGDLLYSLNGLSLGDLSLDRAYEIFQRKVGSPVTFRVERNGEIIRFRLRLEEEL